MGLSNSEEKTYGIITDYLESMVDLIIEKDYTIEGNNIVLRSKLDPYKDRVLLLKIANRLNLPLRGLDREYITLPDWVGGYQILGR